jgi:hypothetical protein
VDQAGVDETLQAIDHTVSRQHRIGAHGFGGLQGPTTSKYRQAAEKHLVGWLEQIETPGECGPQCLLTVGHVRWPARQQ